MRGIRRARQWSVPLAAVLIASAAACVPQPATPTLPPGLGVSWIRDAGGPPPATDGSYVPAWQRFSLLNGTTTGPETGATPTRSPLSFESSAYFGRLFPDGTASFPWNGLAGDGVSTTTSTPFPGFRTDTITYPGGSCSFGSTISGDLRGFVPSPDGTKYAAIWVNFDNYFSAPTTIALGTMGPTGCTTIVSANYASDPYGPRGGTGDGPASNAFVWSQDSSAVLFQLGGPDPGDSGRVMKLNATAGATPVLMIDDGPTGLVVPTGWTSEGWIITTSLRRASSTGPYRSYIEARREYQTASIDVADFSGSTNVVAATHVAYLVPGTTTTLVYNRGSVRVTAPDGHESNRVTARIREVTGGIDLPLGGTEPPLGFHTDNISPTLPQVQVANAEVFDRFVR